MAYIGPKPSQTLATPTSQYFNGTGSQTVFTLNRAVNVSEDLEVFVNNIQQEPGVGKSYTATGTTLTFDGAPSSGTANVYVVYRGLAEVTTRLEHDPNAALAATTGTFSGNVDVTGTVTADGLTVDGTSALNNNVTITQSTSPVLTFTSYPSTQDTVATIYSGRAEFSGPNSFLRFGTNDGTSTKLRMDINQNGDISFYDDQGSSQKLFWDASAEALGIGTTSPAATLHITDSDTSVNGTMRFGSNPTYYAYIKKTYSTDKFDIGTNGSGQHISFTNNGTEHMRLDNSGNVLVGKTTSDTGNSIGFEARQNGLVNIGRSSGEPLILNRNTTDGNVALFRKDGTTVGSIGSRINDTGSGSSYIFAGGGNTCLFYDDVNNYIRPANSTGSGRDNIVQLGNASNRFTNLYLSGGVYLGGTSSAHLLEDYEEGTFNVVLGGSSSTSGQSYGNQTGRYTKIGSLVHCSGYITVSSIGTVTGTYAQLQNLPFTVGSAAPYGNGNYSGGVFSYWNNFNVNSAGFTLYPDTGATFAYVMYRGSFSTSVDYMSPSGWGSNPAIMFSLTYTTDA